MSKTIQNQIQTIKDNWLLLGVAVVLVMFLSGFSSGGSVYSGMAKLSSAPMMEMAMDEGATFRGGGVYMDSDFAPEVEDRIITKYGYLTSEVRHGEFQSEHARAKSIISTADGFLLNENVNKHGEGIREYYTGYYQIKVETSKYSDVLSQLKAIGEVESFMETQDDITGQYTDTELELEVEKERLERYQAMYEAAELVEDKINLNDRIFNQERRIKYLEDALENMDKRVDYSTITFTLNEKQSDFAGLSRLSDFVRSMVGSFNSMINLVFVLIPWALLLLILGFVYRLALKRKK